LAELEDQKNVTLALGSSVAKDPSIQEAFAARDRQRLLDLALPGYELLKAYHITQYQYHLPNGALFLSLTDLNNQENNVILSAVALANT
jgi:methyl-accepting chemotaxis protein